MSSLISYKSYDSPICKEKLFGESFVFQRQVKDLERVLHIFHICNRTMSTHSFRKTPSLNISPHCFGFSLFCPSLYFFQDSVAKLFDSLLMSASRSEFSLCFNPLSLKCALESNAFCLLNAERTTYHNLRFHMLIIAV